MPAAQVQAPCIAAPPCQEANRQAAWRRAGTAAAAAAAPPLLAACGLTWAAAALLWPVFGAGCWTAPAASYRCWWACAGPLLAHAAVAGHRLAESVRLPAPRACLQGRHSRWAAAVMERVAHRGSLPVSVAQLFVERAWAAKIVAGALAWSSEMRGHEAKEPLLAWQAALTTRKQCPQWQGHGVQPVGCRCWPRCWRPPPVAQQRTSPACWSSQQV